MCDRETSAPVHCVDKMQFFAFRSGSVYSYQRAFKSGESRHSDSISLLFIRRLGKGKCELYRKVWYSKLPAGENPFYFETCDGNERDLRCCQDIHPGNTVGVLRHSIYSICDVSGALPQNGKSLYKHSVVCDI